MFNLEAILVALPSDDLLGGAMPMKRCDHAVTGAAVGEDDGEAPAWSVTRWRDS